jgi:hypothetical protein
VLCISAIFYMKKARMNQLLWGHFTYKKQNAHVFPLSWNTSKKTYKMNSLTYINSRRKTSFRTTTSVNWLFEISTDWSTADSLLQNAPVKWLLLRFLFSNENTWLKPGYTSKSSNSSRKKWFNHFEILVGKV